MHHIVESQEEVFAFLADPATHGGAPVERIDTHAACVFLAGAPTADAAAWLAALPRYIDDNDAELHERPRLFPVQDIDALTRATRAALARILHLLQERGARGLIRRGHGDLHLGNIVLMEGK